MPDISRAGAGALQGAHNNSSLQLLNGPPLPPCTSTCLQKFAKQISAPGRNYAEDLFKFAKCRPRFDNCGYSLGTSEDKPLIRRGSLVILGLRYWQRPHCIAGVGLIWPARGSLSSAIIFPSCPDCTAGTVLLFPIVPGPYRR